MPTPPPINLPPGVHQEAINNAQRFDQGGPGPGCLPLIAAFAERKPGRPGAVQAGANVPDNALAVLLAGGAGCAAVSCLVSILGTILILGLLGSVLSL